MPLKNLAYVVEYPHCGQLRYESGDESVPQYRLYHLDGAGCVTGAEWLDAPGDDLAIEAAAIQDSVQCEVWQGRLLVTRLARGAAIPPAPASSGPQIGATRA
jgi:hypothetical protein